MLMTALENIIAPLPATFPPLSKKAQISNHSSGAHQQCGAEVAYQAAVQVHVPLDKKLVCQESFPFSTGFLSS